MHLYGQRHQHDHAPRNGAVGDTSRDKQGVPGVDVGLPFRVFNFKPGQTDIGLPNEEVHEPTDRHKRDGDNSGKFG